MTESYNNYSLDTIKDGLRPLIADEPLLGRVSRDIRKLLAFLNWKPPPESDFYNFDDKVSKVVQHFSPDGLTRRDYLQTAVRRPQLFVQKPETVIDNIESVMAHFEADGLTRRDYLRVAVRQPPLLTRRPSTLIDNVEGVIAHFAADGLTRRDYLRALVQQPSLFLEKPEKVIGRIEGVTAHFTADGLTRRDYLRTAVRRPQLFSQNHETIIRHVNLVTDMHRRGLLNLPKSRRDPPTAMAPVINFLLTYPQILSYSDDNLMLREIHAIVTERSLSPAMLKQPINIINKCVHNILDHPGHEEPVPKLDLDCGAGPHARNLLLRALIREGMVRGRLS